MVSTVLGALISLWQKTDNRQQFVGFSLISVYFGEFDLLSIEIYA